jgi:proteasome lid subunit RPN8/RPN11
MKLLLLDDALRARIAQGMRAAGERECCGLLEGVRSEDAVQVTALHASPNLAADPDRFEIDPALQFRLLREGRNVVGCYHSHPAGQAEPSPRDAEGAGETGFVWLIAGAEGLGAFVWDGARFRRLAIAKTGAISRLRPADAPIV